MGIKQTNCSCPSLTLLLASNITMASHACLGVIPCHRKVQEQTKRVKTQL